MKVTKEALVASRALQGLNTVSLGVSGSCEEEQVMSDVASLVQASLAHPTSESSEVLSVSQAEAHSVTSMLWSSDGILRQALLTPGLVNFSGPDEEKQTKDNPTLDLVNIKPPGTPLPPMSELPRPGSLPGTMSLGPTPEGQLLAESLEAEGRTQSVPTTGSLDSSLLDLHSTESFNGALSQFPCSVGYKLSSSPELLTSHASMDPLPPISEVHKAAAGQLMSSSVSTRDQLLSSQGREKDLSTYQPSSSPLPSDVAGSLLLSSARGPLPTMSSSQVSSLLSALSSDLSNSELPGKELSSLGEIELSPPRKLAEHLSLSSTSKVPVLQLHLNSSSPQKVSTLTQTDQLDELDSLIPLTSSTDTSPNKRNCSENDRKSTILPQLKLIPNFSSNIENNSKCLSPTFEISLGAPVLTLEDNDVQLVEVKQEKSTLQVAKKSKICVVKKQRVNKKKKTDVDKNKKSLVERVACFKCSMCPFLSLDKLGVDQHIEDEHGGVSEDQSKGIEEPQVQELRCPGCPNVFFSIQSLKVHLTQDHRMSDAEVQQIVERLRPLPTSPSSTLRSPSSTLRSPSSTLRSPSSALRSPSATGSAETLPSLPAENTTEQSPSKSEKRPIKRRKIVPQADIEVYTDEQGKIHVRPGPNLIDPAAPEGACSSGGDACESSDNDNEQLSGTPEEESSAADQTNGAKKRGRPKGSRNIGITALKKQNPTLRLGEKELGYCCAVDGCAVRLRSHDNIEYHRRCHSVTRSSFACPECSLEFPQWRILTAHLWRVHGIDMELYACDQCSFKTNSYSKLINLHKRIHGVERPFLCDTCGKGFKTSKQLRNHKVIHNNGMKPRPLKSGECDICFRHFTDKRMLRLHKDTVHEKLRPFLCNYCGYSASSRSTLKMHMRQHTGEKPFACSECDYRTADHNSLRRHRMRHSGQKQYQCPHCAYACIQSSTYKTHLRNKHPGLDDGLLFSCPHCPFRTIKKDNHVAHLAEHQNGSISTPTPSTTKQTKAKTTSSSSKSNKSSTITDQTANENTSSNATAVLPTPAVSKKKQSSISKKKQAKQIAQAAEEVIREIESARTTSKDSDPSESTSAATTESSTNQVEETRPMLVSVASTVVRSSDTALPENLQFMYSGTNNITTLENFLQPCFSSSDDSRYPMLSSQLKMSELGSSVFTVVDGKQLVQLGPSDLVPITLSPAQASALQLALASGNGEPEQITGDIAEGNAHTNVANVGESLEIKFKVAEDLHGSS